ncbi:hypothetical protein CR513_42650, partial [Mucuna pruriens]
MFGNVNLSVIAPPNFDKYNTIITQIKTLVLRIVSKPTIGDFQQSSLEDKEIGDSIWVQGHCKACVVREIDFQRLNPMTYEIDIQNFNLIIQENWFYTLLDGLDDRLDKVQSDVWQIKSFPTVEQVYAFVQRKDARQIVMTTKTMHIPIGKCRLGLGNAKADSLSAIRSRLTGNRYGFDQKRFE